MAIHYTILAWKIPWTEKPGGLESMGLQILGHGKFEPISLCLRKNGNSHKDYDKFFLRKERRKKRGTRSTSAQGTDQDYRPGMA